VSETTPDEGRLRGIHSALVRYRVLAWVTGVVLASLTLGLVWMAVTGRWADRSTYPWYALGWTAHGWLFVVYLITAVDLFTRVRWPWGRAILVVLAGTIPFASFFAERWATHDVRRRFPAAGSGRSGGLPAAAGL